MPVSDQHKLYTNNKDKWQLVRDAVAGSDAIKAARRSDSSNDLAGIHNIAGSRYLPPPNPSDNSTENKERFDAYKTRASFVNFTGHTKDGFVGMICRKPSIIELDQSIQHIVDNSDGAGLSFQGLIQSIISNVLDVGRHGLLADFPMSEGGTQAQTGDLKAFVKEYPAESIVNWRTEIINGKPVSTMIVLAEETEKIAVDGFSSECVTFHRVLFLDEGIYKQNLYDEDGELIFFSDEDGEPNPDIIPLMSDGSPWREIPFIFVGSEDNSPSPDKAPLYDLAEVNIAHYRNSADFEESSFMVGQPTPVFTGLTQGWVNDVLKSGVQLGSRTGVLLPDGANALLLQASANQMPSAGMEMKETQMVKIGAKIIVDAGGVETAEAAKIRFAGQNSKLGRIVSNTEDALLIVSEWLTLFMGGSGESEIDINREFYDASVNPQLLVAQMQLLDRGVIAKSDMRTSMRKSGQIAHDRMDEDIDQEVGNIDPLL